MEPERIVQLQEIASRDVDARPQRGRDEDRARLHGRGQGNALRRDLGPDERGDALLPGEGGDAVAGGGRGVAASLPGETTPGRAGRAGQERQAALGTSGTAGTLGRSSPVSLASRSSKSRSSRSPPQVHTFCTFYTAMSGRRLARSARPAGGDSGNTVGASIFGFCPKAENSHLYAIHAIW